MAKQGAGDDARLPQLEEAAWRVLADTLSPDGRLGTLPPEGLSRLIQLRLAREAQRLGVSEEALAAAFERALADFTRRRPAE